MIFLLFKASWSKFYENNGGIQHILARMYAAAFWLADILLLPAIIAPQKQRLRHVCGMKYTINFILTMSRHPFPIFSLKQNISLIARRYANLK